jgi:DNA-binding transcriptional LysR family regulator
MPTIDPVDLRGVDLNLLVSLQALLTERHVTRSAEKLGITQPAMSASLARARTLFNDKLLVRGPKGLVLTPRGEQILEQLSKVMEMTGRLIALPGEFIPETSDRTFTLMGSDCVEFLLLPSLMTALAKEAPNVQIVFKLPDRKSLETMLANRELDLVIGYMPEPPNDLIRYALFEDPFVCVGRRDHPFLRNGLTLEVYIELAHVQVLSGNATMYGDDIDTALAAIGLVRKVVLWEPTFLAIGNVVGFSDLISTVPKRVATDFSQRLPISIYEPPLTLPLPEFALYWHARSQEDTGHKWLRRKIAALLRGGDNP